MGQQEVLSLLETYPRLCTKEIAQFLGKEEWKISKILNKLKKNREISIKNPDDEELERILSKFPTAEFGIKNGLLKVYEVKDE